MSGQTSKFQEFVRQLSCPFASERLCAAINCDYHNLGAHKASVIKAPGHTSMIIESTVDLFAEFLRLRYPTLSVEFLEFKIHQVANSPSVSVAPVAFASSITASVAPASYTAASVATAAPMSPILAPKTSASTVAASAPTLRSSAAYVTSVRSSAASVVPASFTAPARSFQASVAPTTSTFAKTPGCRSHVPSS